MKTPLSGLLCVALILSASSFAAADETYQGGGNFFTDSKMKANTTPLLWAVMTIPDGLNEGDPFVVSCLIETYKNGKKAKKPVKGTTGTVATFANRFDVGNGSWQFFGLVGSGLPFTTTSDGTGGVTTGAVTAGAWANDPGTNDSISIAVTFTNARKVHETRLGCEMTLGAPAD